MFVGLTLDQPLEDYAGGIAAGDIPTYGDCLAFDQTFIFTEDVADSLHLPLVVSSGTRLGILRPSSPCSRAFTPVRATANPPSSTRFCEETY
jgi:hypothetical protein